MNLKEIFQNYFSKKSKLSKLSDLLFVLFIAALLVPQGRMKIMSMVNKGKMMIIKPSLNSVENTMTLNDSDYQLMFHDLKGENFDFSKVKGKVIFINFWATWCPPCVAELQSIQELYNLYKDNNQVAFLIVGNEEPDVIQNFITNKSYSFPVYINKFQLPDLLKTTGIPATFVISKKGKIVVSEEGAMNWASDDMKKIMNNLIKE